MTVLPKVAFSANSPPSPSGSASRRTPIQSAAA